MHAAAPTVHVLSAPDPEEEAKRSCADFCGDVESGVPLWRMAVLYTADEPYAALVRETLDAARIPWHSALGRPAAAGWRPVRCSALLALRERRFAREAVLEWLVARPPTSTAADDDPLPAVPVSAWDRLSRRAQVLEGADQWIARFERLIRTLEVEEAAAQRLARRSPRARSRRGHAASGTRPRARARDRRRPSGSSIATPARPLNQPPGMRWWTGRRPAVQLRAQTDPTWPDAERQAAAALDEALDSLRAGQRAGADDDGRRLRRRPRSRTRGAPPRRRSVRRGCAGRRRSDASTGAAFERVTSWAWPKVLLRARRPPTRCLPAAERADPLATARPPALRPSVGRCLRSLSSADGHDACC